MKRFVLPLLLALPALLFGQEKPKDPFATPPSIKQAARRGATAGTPGKAGPAPRVALAVRGSLKMKGKPSAALLQAGERITLVRAGDRLQVQGFVLKIESIKDGAVTVRWAGDDQSVTVR